VTLVVRDLISTVTSDRGYEVKPLVSIDLAEDDVTDLRGSVMCDASVTFGYSGRDRHQLARLDATLHGVSARAELDRLSIAELVDVL
jgi:hypothetical protein